MNNYLTNTKKRKVPFFDNSSTISIFLRLTSGIHQLKIKTMLPLFLTWWFHKIGTPIYFARIHKGCQGERGEINYMID